MKRKIPNFNHLNNNLLCAIDVETTGLRPDYHEIFEIAIIPLDANLDPIDEILPFHQFINPMHKDRISKKAMSKTKMNSTLLAMSPDPFAAADLFEKWFEDMITKNGYRRIAPLAHNWKFDHAFIEQWLGFDMETMDKAWMDEFFEPRARDTMRAAIFLNDLAYHHAETYPFPKVNLSYLANIFELPHFQQHTALDDALTTARVYKNMMRLRLRGGLDFGMER